MTDRPQRPALVIFDCDGVLVDSEPVSDRVLSANLTRHGIQVTPKEAGDLFTGGTMRLIGEWARTKNPDLPADWIDEIYAETFEALRNVPAIPGAVDAVERIRAAGVPIRIASNGPQGKMAITLRRVGLWDAFGGPEGGRIHSCHDHDEPKPGPEMLLRAMRLEGVSPDGTVMVGDTLNDANAARAAGVRCFGLVDRTTAEAFEAHGATPMASMAALPGLLGL